jgi:hypothetical protein
LEPLQVLGGFGVIAAVILLQLGKETPGPSSALEIRQEGKRLNVALSEQRL